MEARRGWAACNDKRDGCMMRLGCVRRLRRRDETQMCAAVADAQGSWNACSGSQETAEMWGARAYLRYIAPEI
ncbi:hypothetical protein HN873_019281 [Arachis hypogaea]